MATYRMLSKEVGPGVVSQGEGGCPGKTCPATLLRSDGKAVVVGKRMSKAELQELEGTGMVKVYEDEFAIVVDPELLKTGVREL